MYKTTCKHENKRMHNELEKKLKLKDYYVAPRWVTRPEDGISEREIEHNKALEEYYGKRHSASNC